MEQGSRLDSHSTKLPLRKGVLLQKANLNEQIDNGSSPDTGPVIGLIGSAGCSRSVAPPESIVYTRNRSLIPTCSCRYSLGRSPSNPQGL